MNERAHGRAPKLRLLCNALSLVAVMPGELIAQVPRWQEPVPAVRAFQSGDFNRARDLLKVEYDRCQARRPKGDECLDLLLGLSNTSGYAGDGRGGEDYARTAVALAGRALGPDHPDLGRAWLQLGDRLDQEFRTAEAESFYRKALTLFEKALPNAASETIETAGRLIGNLSRQGRYTEAEWLARRSVALRAASGDAIARAEGDLVLANILAEVGKTEESEALYLQSLSAFERELPPGSPRVAQMYLNLGGFFFGLGRYEAAEEWQRKALAYGDKHSPADPIVMHAAYYIALTLEEQERDQEAELYFRRSLQLRTAHFQTGHPLIVGAHGDLARNLAYQKRFAEADAMYKKMAALRPAFSQASDLNMIQWAQAYADFLTFADERPSEGITHYRDAQRGFLERVRSFGEFDAAAQGELEAYRTLFTNMIDAAWAISRKQTEQQQP